MADFDNFLIQLKAIFLKEDNTTNLLEITKKIKSFCVYINEKIIKKKENYLKLDYTDSNLLNILKFIRMQNEKYAAEIFENLCFFEYSILLPPI